MKSPKVTVHKTEQGRVQIRIKLLRKLPMELLDTLNVSFTKRAAKRLAKELIEKAEL